MNEQEQTYLLPLTTSQPYSSILPDSEREQKYYELQKLKSGLEQALRTNRSSETDFYERVRLDLNEINAKLMAMLENNSHLTEA